MAACTCRNTGRRFSPADFAGDETLAAVGKRLLAPFFADDAIGDAARRDLR
jgi:hypothetical protein